MSYFLDDDDDHDDHNNNNNIGLGMLSKESATSMIQSPFHQELRQHHQISNLHPDNDEYHRQQQQLSQETLLSQLSNNNNEYSVDANDPSRRMRNRLARGGTGYNSSTHNKNNNKIEPNTDD